MEKITGKSLYEKTCPPGKVCVVSGKTNLTWEKLSESVRSAWEKTAENMEKFRKEGEQ